VLPAAEDNGARLELCPDDVAQELDAVLHERKDERFRYYLTCRRILEALNSAYRESSAARRRYPVNWAYFNPDDMADEGIVEGEIIRLQSGAGSVLGVVKPDNGLRRGVISMTHLFGDLGLSTDPMGQGGSFTGRLTSLQHCLEPINFMPRFSGIPVNVLRC
jgi:anaerobic selenocysteine-containing dehydrogenase